MNAHFYKTREWQELRWEALKRCGYKCMGCGRRPPHVRLHVDHIKPRSTHPHLELRLDNLQVLCEDCNLGKSNKDETNFRVMPSSELIAQVEKITPAQTIQQRPKRRGGWTKGKPRKKKETPRLKSLPPKIAQHWVWRI